MTEIVELDLETADPAAVDECVELAGALRRDQRPDEPVGGRAWALVQVTPSDPGEVVRLWTARVDGRLAALGTLWRFGGENTHLAELDARVLPEFRGRGVGRALITVLEDAYRETDCTAATAVTVVGAHGEVGAALLERAGCKAAQQEALSALAVAEADPRVPGWAAGEGARTDGYSLVRWTGSCPEELVEEFAVACMGLNDAPTGDLDWRPERIDAETVRAIERRAAEQQRERYVLAVREDATGRIGGYTSITCYADTPRAYISSTAVLRDHRGRGFGRWLKAAQVEWLREARPDITSHATGNAVENEHMLRINGELGYRRTQVLQMWQR